MILQGEDCRVGIESTVLDMSEGHPVILRPGIITKEQLENVLLRPVEIDPALTHDPKDRGDFLKPNNIPIAHIILTASFSAIGFLNTNL